MQVFAGDNRRLLRWPPQVFRNDVVEVRLVLVHDVHWIGGGPLHVLQGDRFGRVISIGLVLA